MMEMWLQGNGKWLLANTFFSLDSDYRARSELHPKQSLLMPNTNVVSETDDFSDFI